MRKVLVNLCRFFVGIVFIFSGFVKAVDPLGTQYKIDDYLTALELTDMLPGLVTLAASVALSAIEFCCGVFLVLAINRRKTSRVTMGLMVLMTAISLWLWIANPISDCGCFGDAVHLTNFQTLLKNVILLSAAAVLCKWPLLMVRFISKTNQWIAMNYSLLFIVGLSLWSLYSLPLFDFRPYHVGANIPKGMEIPEGAEAPTFETTFVMEKDGERKVFSLDNYPDSTWTFVSSSTVQTSQGYVPPIHDFSITRMADGEDITDEVLSDKGYTFLLVSPHLENASDTNFGEIDHLCEYAQDNGYPFYCLTASGGEAVERWRELTGAEYAFCTADEITLKTIIRSNPGLVLIKDGNVIRKWSHNRLPAIEEELMKQPLEKLEIGHLPDDTVARRIAAILTWFVLPLFLLTVADRLWAWTRWLKRKSKDSKDNNSTLTTNEENEKENCSR